MGIKRNRVTKVCDFCKKRRVKCDLEDPCGTCVKYKKQCVYSSTSSKTINVHDELRELKLKLKTLERSVKPVETQKDVNEFVHYQEFLGNNQIESDSDTINFFERLTPSKDKDPIRKRNSGPLSWITLIKNDHALSLLWNSMSSVKDHFNHRVFTNDKIDTENERDFTRKVEEDGNHVASIGLSFYKVSLTEDIDLIEKIRLLLPPPRIIWLLYDRFFSILYPVFPILDETTVKVQLQIIFERNLVIEKKQDFIYLGILLLILRLSFISLFSHDSSTNEFNINHSELKYFYDNPISIEVVPVAVQCFHLFNFMKNSNLALLQLGVMIRLYHAMGPEEGDGLDGGDAEVSIAMLIKMALQMEIHREPNSFKGAFQNEKLNNLGRKIWFTLLIQDLDNAMAHGTNLNVNAYSFDTEIPSHIPGNENVIDANMEKIAVSGFPNLDTAYEPIYDLQNMLFKVKGTVNLAEFTQKLNFLEIYVDERYGTILEDYRFDLNLEDSFSINIYLKIYLDCTFWLISIYSHLMNQYERKRNVRLVYFYTKKSFILLGMLMPFLHKYMNQDLSKLKAPNDLLITPTLEMACHKATIVVSSLSLRLQYCIHDLQTKYDHAIKMNSTNMEDMNYKSHFEKLISCFDLSSRWSKLFLASLTKLSHRYYYAWRTAKAQKYISALVDDEFIQSNKPTFPTNLLTTEMLGDLEHIMSSSLDKINTEGHANHTQNSTIRRSNQSPTNSINSETNLETDSLWMQMLHSKYPKFTEILNYDIPTQLNFENDQIPGFQLQETIDDYLFDDFTKDFM